MASRFLHAYSPYTLTVLLSTLNFTAYARYSSTTSSAASSIATNLDFEVPEPIQATSANASNGCGKELSPRYTTGGDTAGPYNFTTSDGYGREYTIYVPKYYDPQRASPLILALPGNTHTYEDIEKQTELSDEDMNPYAIAVFVSGVNLGFVSNPGYGATEDATYPDVDDISFVKDFLDDLEDRFCVDTGRIWVVGHSNGAGLTNVLACDPTLSSRISVFAANSGAFYTNHTDGDPQITTTDTTVQANCSPGRSPIPYIEFHGTDDETISYTGADDHSSYGVRVLPDIQHWASSWAVRNGYSTDNVTSSPDDDVQVYQWGGPDNLGVVTHYRLQGWIHDYARKSAGAPVDATPIIMEFFYNQSDFKGVPASYPSSRPSSTASATPSSSATAASAASVLTSTTTFATFVGILLFALVLEA